MFDVTILDLVELSDKCVKKKYIYNINKICFESLEFTFSPNIYIYRSKTEVIGAKEIDSLVVLYRTDFDFKNIVPKSLNDTICYACARIYVKLYSVTGLH